MQTAVIVFPASNCDRDAAMALEKVTGRAPHMVWHRETSLPAEVDSSLYRADFPMAIICVQVPWLHAHRS